MEFLKFLAGLLVGGGPALLVFGFPIAAALSFVSGMALIIAVIKKESKEEQQS